MMHMHPCSCEAGTVQTAGAEDLALSCNNGSFSTAPALTCTPVEETCALPALTGIANLDRYLT
jgi:hypothetical protein